MKFIMVDYEAVNALVSLKQSQNIEYAFGKSISCFLKGSVFENILPGFNFTKSKDGGYVFCNNTTFKKGIIFDLTHFNGFRTYSEEEALTIFQKTLRFSIRHWSNAPYTKCEKNLAGTTKSIVIPFSFSAGDAYKVFVEKKPDAVRMSKRSGEYILIFRDGFGKNYDLNEVSVTQFRKALGGVSEQLSNLQVIKETNDCGIPGFNVFCIDEKDHPVISAQIGFETWQHYLTEKQKDFIFNIGYGPDRLEGAAGTGKTLSLVLRCINLMKEVIAEGRSAHILFITHSISTKDNIIEIFHSNFPEIIRFKDRYAGIVSLNVTTLQEWCIEHLGAGIEQTEYLDRDAQDSKEIQLLYLSEALDDALKNDFESYKDFLSQKVITFFENTDNWALSELLQHEISVMIKGRAKEDIVKYRKITRPKYGIPVECEGDFNFLFLIFKNYRNKLIATNQFDSDDIILSAMGQLNTPIWRRRRNTEGYDVTFIDETHLFNINELSIFHYLNKETNKNSIIFTIDIAQAVGDRDLNNEVINKALEIENIDLKGKVKFETVFRSSPDIVNLAFNILSSGATLFTNFENPLNKIAYSFTNEEENKSLKPVYKSFATDRMLISGAFSCAENMAKTINVPKSTVLIVATTEILLRELEQFAISHNKALEILKCRGDIKSVHKAINNGKFVLGGMDYIGGLEFNGVIIVGADKGRLPPLNCHEKNIDSYHFMNYSSHNRLYVALTRAKYTVELLGEKSRGNSELLSHAIENDLLNVED